MKVLVVEDDPIMQATLKTVFKDAEVSLASSFHEATSLLEKTSFHVAFLDINLKSGTSGDGIELLQKIRERDNYLPCVMISGVTDKNTIIKCLDNGAVDYVIKADGHPEVYRLALHKALMWKKIFSESALSRIPLGIGPQGVESPGINPHGTKSITDVRRGQQTSGPYALLGQSHLMVELRELIAKAGALNGPYLILGETGTGKELVARQIWSAKGEKNRPFIAVNCAGLPENLVESELFGYERGAFTGALTTKTGLFEAANGGDIFLDEIGELNTDLQAKLLRVLQEKKVRRLGSDRERPVDFRVIAATNVDLGQAIEMKEFREDLFYRLNVHQIRIPDLKSRREDILPLMKSFFTDLNLGEVSVSDKAQMLLADYAWPGNVRQLKAFTQSVIPFLNSDRTVGETLVLKWMGLNQIGKSMKQGGKALLPEEEIRKSLEGGEKLNIVEKLDGIQRSYVYAALKLTENNRSQAASALGVSRQRLSNWLSDWGESE